MPFHVFMKANTKVMKNTIWYVTKYFPVKTGASPGGRGWFLVKEMQRAGCRLVVISSDSNNLIDIPKLKGRVVVQEVDGVQVVWLNTIKYSIAKSMRRIISWVHFEWNLFWLNKGKFYAPDVIIISSLSLLTVVNGLFLRRKYKCKLVFEVRDIWPLTLIEEGGYNSNNIIIKILAWLERLAYERYDVIVGTMPNLAAHVRSISGSTKPVYCVPMGVSNEHLDDAVELHSAYIQQYLSSSKFKIVHAGTIGITNALDTFFDAAEAMVQYTDIEFIVVGDGALKKAYEAKYGGLPNVIFAPKVSRNAVQAVLKRCDILYFSVHESKVWDYGQSLNKVIDYMLAGRPVVASYGGYPSMINEACCGVFVPPNNVEAAISAFLDMKNKSVEDRVLMGGRGRDWLLNNRSYSKLASDYLEILLRKEL